MIRLSDIGKEVFYSPYLSSHDSCFCFRFHKKTVAGWKFHKGRREEHHLMRETELTDEVSDAPGPNEDV